MSFASSLKDLTVDQKKVLKQKPINELNESELRIRLQLMEEELANVTMAAEDEKRGLGDLLPTDLVIITVPASPTKEQFEINGVKYFGRCKVQKRTAETLMEMISGVYRHERELIISKGNADSKFGYHPPMETLATIERYKTIMGEENA